MTTKDGGPAFPHRTPDSGGYPGMSLRDYFTGQALVGIAANPEKYNSDPLVMTRSAVRLADDTIAMLAQREEK